MRHKIQQAVMVRLHLAVAMGASACLPPPGVACGDAWCSDQERCVSLGSSVEEQQLACVTQTIGQSCMVDTECAPVGICSTGRCRVAQSCAEILQHIPGSRDGVYSIAPNTTAPFSAFCDMTRDGGGWTLLLKANGDSTLGYSKSAWTDASLLNPTDLTTQPGNAKYQSFLSLPITTLRSELDGFLYSQDLARMTAQQIFKGPTVIIHRFPTFNNGAPNWSTQPNCQIFGVNTSFAHTRTRFGWSANDQNDCSSNDTAIGLGLMNDGFHQRGAGYECLDPSCSPESVDTAGHGLLWGRE
jgi:hypothetical protein